MENQGKEAAAKRMPDWDAVNSLPASEKAALRMVHMRSELPESLRAACRVCREDADWTGMEVLDVPLPSWVKDRNVGCQICGRKEG